jgi:hypothetical protein
MDRSSSASAHRIPWSVAIGCAIGLGALAPACELSTSKGAQAVFSQQKTCPLERVKVRPRPDVPPHTLLEAPASQQPIPPEVAADPERLAMWNKTHQSTDANIDQVATTYEVDGCGDTAMYVCDHPTVADVQTGSPYIVGDTGFVKDDTIALSAVECVPPLALREAEHDATSRIEGTDVVHVPAHSAMPTVPDALRGLRVLAIAPYVESKIASAARRPPQGSCSAAKLFEPLGWVEVSDASEPHDLVVRTRCAGSGVVTGHGAMYVLEPRQQDDGPRLETPDGQLIDQLQPGPVTFACPVADTVQCGEAVQQYKIANFIGQVVASTKLASYVAKLATPRD